METENLWAREWREFWRDPKTVRAFFLSDAFVRRFWKLAWLITTLFVLWFVVLPTQQKSWALWLTDDVLAHNTAAGVTFGSFFVIGVARYAYEGGARALGGAAVVLASVLLFFSLIGAWNYYAHDNALTSGVAATATSGAADRVDEAKKALDDFEARTTASLKSIDEQLAATPANYPTGRSRLLRARTDAETNAGEERARLRAELQAARGSNVETLSTNTDTRPVDQFLANITGFKRADVASFTDLMRSGAFEFMIIIGGALSAVAATSRVGVPLTGEAPAPPATPSNSETIEVRYQRRRIRQTRLRAPTEAELAAWRRELAGEPEPASEPEAEPMQEPEPQPEPEREEEFDDDMGFDDEPVEPVEAEPTEEERAA